MNCHKKIFTFWEPQAEMPAYLQLCMATWKKFLPDFEIITLDYNNLKEYIGDCYDKILFKNFSLPKQADAIRCAVLNRYGGVWLDTDTIITSTKVVRLLEYCADFVIIDRHIGFIVASRGADILQKWETEIKRRLEKYKTYHLLSKFFYPPYYKKLKKWDYLGNGCIDEYLFQAKPKDFYSIPKHDIQALPEINFFANTKQTPREAYTKFWFEGNHLDYITQNDSGGIICLHNSWTPKEIKRMGKEEFLLLNNTLSRLLSELNQ